MLCAILLLVFCQANVLSAFSLASDFAAIKDQQSEFYEAIRNGAEKDLVHAATLKGFEAVCSNIADRLDMSNQRTLKSNMRFLYSAEDGDEYHTPAQPTLSLIEPQAHTKPDSLLQAEKAIEREKQVQLFEANKALYVSMRAAHRAEMDLLNQRLEDMRAYGPTRKQLLQYRLVDPVRACIVGLPERARASAQAAVRRLTQEAWNTAYTYLSHRQKTQDAAVAMMAPKKVQQPAKACSSVWQEMSLFVNN